MKAISIIALGAIAAAAAAAGAAPRAAAPYCLQPGDDATPLTVRATDGAQLQGLLFGSTGKLGIVLGHQNLSDLCEWHDEAARFAAAGYRALAIDFRGFGSSPRPTGANALRLPADVAGAAAELRRRGARRIVAVGSSMGGTAAIVAAANRTNRIEGVVSLSGASAFEGMDALNAAKRLVVLARFAAAARDTGFARDARALTRTARSSDKAVLVVPGADHGTFLLQGSSGPRVRAFVDAFLKKLAPPA
jgi:pimeloyl-ACP methyl ester carboxylesterase